MSNTKKKTTKKVSSNNNRNSITTLKKEIESKELKKKNLEKINKEIEQEEDKGKRKKWLLLLLLLFLFIFVSFGLTYSLNEEFRDSVDENVITTFKIDTPTRPEIDGGSRNWSKKQIIKVVKDAKSYSGIKYYEYCVSSDKNFGDCEWKKTETKNMVSSTTGKYFVVFRGVSNNGKVGSNSNIEETWIDNEGPTITELSIDNTKNGIKVDVGAKDIHSGVDSYYYKLDNGEYKKVKATFDVKLDEEREYEITIKVVDKLGNYKEVSKKFVYDLEDEVCRLNCDTDGDGDCDFNCDTDGDGDCDLNCDTDGDGKCDIKCDTDGDGKCDIKCEDDTTGKEPEPSASPSPSDKPSPSASATPEPSDSPKPTTKPTPSPAPDDEEELIPEINLDKVPLEFFYGESYELPSFVDFKGDTGTVSCIVEGVEYTDTSTLKIGKHLIVCTATSSKNIKVMVEKEVEVKANVGPDEVWDGWIKLNLYYPENSTNWEWRIGKEGEIRTGYDNTDWQDYTGPILVRLEDVDDVYIRYDLDGETVIVAPKGRILVDIVPEKFTLNKGEKTKVEIYYDEKAETKEYKINDGDWKEYTDAFEVEANTIIEARVTKSEKVYDSNGDYVYTSKRKGTDSVFIGEIVEPNAPGGTVGGIPYGPTPIPGPGGITVTIPGPGSKPSTYLAGPEITSNPSSEIVESTKITITPQETAEKVYYSVNNGNYSEYTGSFEINQNVLIKAYYVRLSDGKVSEVSYYYVNNIKKNNLPYVRINTSPNNYLSEDVDSVEVSISGSDYDTLEYSLDGVVYSNYTTPLTITESSTVYARGTNQYGQTIESRTIVTVNSPKQLEELDISIHLNPSKEQVKGLVNKTTVSIDYDSRATKKYYKLGSSSEWILYTGEFEVNQNTTIYAYCTSDDGKGSATKQISFLTTGISDPIINADTKTKAPQVKVDITYDDSAEIMRYQIGDGPLLDYNGAFYVYENTTIRAYNKNILGYEAESSLTINNIVPGPNYIVIDKGKYFIIKLNYPTDSKVDDREYKWKPDGVWKVYDPQGILLIKPEYKDEFDLESADGVKVKDENGKEVIFTDHYYLIDVPFSELMENLFMRWDTVKPSAPTIVLDTEEATKKVEVGIIYSNILVEKYYKVVAPDGSDTGWKEYTGPIEITDNESIIYAKGVTRAEIESKVSSKKIINIDKIAPEINVVGDLTTPKQKVTLKITAKDNLGIDKVKWVKGEKKASYFEDNGTVIPNNGTFTVTENGKYTVYASDLVGHEVTMTVEVTNIDKNAPDIIIDVLTEKYGTEAEVSIDYADSKIKQYRIGEGSTEYKTYTENIIIKSNDVLDLANEDGSLTIYARGRDEAGNVTEVSEKIYVLDLDAPATPIIHSTVGYPVLTEYGVTLGKDNYIVYDETRDDVTNYYSIDNGKTWEVYTGPFEIKSGTIMAKSVKNESGLTISTSKKVVMPRNALGPEAYDEDLSTYYGVSSKEGKAKMLVDPNANITQIYLKGSFSNYGGMVGVSSDGTRTSLLPSKISQSVDGAVTIPEDTVEILISNWDGHSIVYEISAYSQPIINSEKFYPMLTEYGVEVGYNKVTLDYFQTTVERLYRINEGEWKEYQDKEIRLEIGDTIEAKGVGRDGKETYITTYNASAFTDAIGVGAYDNDLTTSYGVISKERKAKMLVDPNANITQIYLKGSFSNYGGMVGVSSDGTRTSLLPSKISQSVDGAVTIPEDTVEILISNWDGHCTVYEIDVYSIPSINVSNLYPTLTEYGVVDAYNEVTIDYFRTTVEKLYRINEGEWKEYKDKKIRLEIGDTIEVKGIDKYGEDTYTSNYKSVLVSDAMGINAYDGDNSTRITPIGKLAVDKSLYGNNIKLVLGCNGCGAAATKVYFTLEDGSEVSENIVISSLQIVPVPENAKLVEMKIGNSGFHLYEIGPTPKPTIHQLNTYPTLSSDNFEDIDYQVKINYLSYFPQKLYSLDNGKTWLEYKDVIDVKVGDVIKAKAREEDGTESEITTYTVKTLTDALGSKAFDSDKSSVYILAKNTSNSFTVTNDTIGRRLRVYVTNIPDVNSNITIYDENNNALSSTSLVSVVTTMDIPENAYKVTIASGNNTVDISEINLRPEIEKGTLLNPIISINDNNWAISKTIEIAYPEGYTNQYSLDGGETWTEYTSEFTITESSVVIARSIDANGEVVVSSSYTITKIDTTNPTVTIEIPDEITVGDEYKLPTSYTVDDTKSGGNVICKIGEDEVNNTSSLDLGTYEIVCTVTTGVGNSTSVVKNVTVKDVLVDITLDLDNRILLGTSNSLPSTVTGGTALCKVGDTTVTNTSELEVGLHNIICTVTSSKGTVKEISREIEIYKESLTDEENTETSESEGELNETATE